VSGSVLVVGSSGSAHALAWKLADSAVVGRVESAPGNPGMAGLGPCHEVDVDDTTAVAELTAKLAPDLVVVTLEKHLVRGLTDELTRRDVPVFGPTRAAARLEGSKAFAKEVMAACGVPTPRSETFGDARSAHAGLAAFSPSAACVVKAVGLSASQGVRVCGDEAEAHMAIDDVLAHREPGVDDAQILIEEFVAGPEASVFALCDGRDAHVLSPARDAKRLLDGDQGPNTGGMGAFSPVPGFRRAEADWLRERVVRPVLAELADRGTPFTGVLYTGLVLTAAGPQVLEFNVRPGNPEAQVVLPRMDGDLGRLMMAAMDGTIGDVEVGWHDDAFVTVALASAGYPDAFPKGISISGVERAEAHPGALVFHTGTRLDGGQLVTSEGRVLTVTGRGSDLDQARAVAYAAADEISFDGLQRRSDIGLTRAAG
jgi:phosphoribosylamine--glycine ligase